ncbi:MAG TPA: putative glycolipid-binding domain-containing protein [Thermomonospora sp.]|nr:putative glycolipid-binding domain-containing protein [Thermomonospora sp.]
MTTSVVWVKPQGAELAEVEFEGRTLSAAGWAVGGGPLPYRVEYELTTADAYVTARLLVRVEGVDPDSGPWRRSLELANGPGDVWTVRAKATGHVTMPPPGGDATTFTGALDCDLGLSPLTNTMPVLRSGLLDGGGPVELLMAWVAVPELTVTPSRQTYTFVRREGELSVVNFATEGFTEDIVFGPDGLVVDYPGIGRAVT